MAEPYNTYINGKPGCQNASKKLLPFGPLRSFLLPLPEFWPGPAILPTVRQLISVQLSLVDDSTSFFLIFTLLVTKSTMQLSIAFAVLLACFLNSIPSEAIPLRARHQIQVNSRMVTMPLKRLHVSRTDIHPQLVSHHDHNLP
jgi:hypothetical protein